ncbi:MAG: N-acetyltransferase family protein [Erysipelotrichaceae bacterium]|nr:N-acetyltransferase family protein [Erysipelotrichaceae bacterium]
MIRTITDLDVEQVLAIYNYYIKETTITFETEELIFDRFIDRVHAIIDRYPFLVYEENGKILGYAYLAEFNPRSAYQWSADLSIYVDKEVHHQGIGRQLYEAIEKIAIQQGFVNIVSLVTEENKNSVRFHERMGFKFIGTFEKVGYKFDRWLGVSYGIKQIQEPVDNPRVLF